MEEAVVLKVVAATIAEGELLTGGATEVAVFAAVLEDASWSRLSNPAEMRCWTVCGGTWLPINAGTEVVVVAGIKPAVGVMSAGVVVIVSVAVE
jgi:hypothetical protein